VFCVIGVARIEAADAVAAEALAPIFVGIELAVTRHSRCAGGPILGSALIVTAHALPIATPDVACTYPLGTAAPHISFSSYRRRVAPRPKQQRRTIGVRAPALEPPTAAKRPRRSLAPLRFDAPWCRRVAPQLRARVT
jgi:hypothetical protein